MIEDVSDGIDGSSGRISSDSPSQASLLPSDDEPEGGLSIVCGLRMMWRLSSFEEIFILVHDLDECSFFKVQGDFFFLFSDTFSQQ